MPNIDYPNNPNIGYAQFSIHQNRVISENSLLNWNGTLKISEGRPPITTNYEYTINWEQLPLENHFFILI